MDMNVDIDIDIDIGTVEIDGSVSNAQHAPGEHVSLMD